ncbi:MULTISPECIES: hypothetical protein [unclassified Sporosarcina]|uniref:hypothetical protein n=1 Tax=unclassified Sporosarcina TaxID=2647733 RepID=UPI002041BE3A|nr:MULTISPECIES: hypothetical protein [unclassified Sporosarcina]GKV65473.1 hypothetical protein NCCP2331_16260 [Sporosarcina sp. NCCP-2331]GLB55597.1 hypothetical protein NCCP2378_13840 [Sporosarcina sp. NCCP-2378]
MKNTWRTNRLQGLQAHATKTVNDLITEAYAKGYEDGKGEAQFDEAMDQVATIKSANQQRAELIQRAREFVEVKLDSLKDSTVVNGGLKVKMRENPTYSSYVTKIEFIVNAEKGTVVALLRYVNKNEVLNKGIAKCMPGEVFNEWIGKAIALARALEIDVPVEFLEAVQPDKKVPGMIVCHPAIGRSVTLTANKRILNVSEANYFSQYADESLIIDDSNAEYEVS